MKITIRDKHKKDLFIALFHILKNCSTIINISFDIENVHIQGMDKSHICLFDIYIQKKWFNNYEVDELTKVAFDINVFHLIISNKTDGYDILIHSESEDNLNIDLLISENTKGEFNKYFKIPLCEYDYEEMDIPSTDYAAEFYISSKKICEIVNQMVVFGTDINIQCSEEKIDMITSGVTGEMLVNIPIDELTEFSIIEGETINLTYSLSYMNKMCLSNKLSSEIEFFMSSESPMKIKYDLGDESTLMFFIAPKIND